MAIETTTALVMGLAGAYLAASVNFSILLFRLLGKDDPRGKFSGNPGATNVYRQAGWFWAAAVLTLDAGRAMAVAVLAAVWLPPAAVAWTGLALIAGNHWPVFHHFRGGKGVANYLGFSVLLAPAGAAAGVAGWLLAMALWRKPFIASFVLVGCLGIGTLVQFDHQWASVAGVGATLALIIFSHQSNMAQWWAARRA